MGTLTPNYLLPLPITVNGAQLSTQLTLDANWRWWNAAGTTTNCFANGWNSQYCPDPLTCSKNCQIQGVSQSQWASPYGVTAAGNAVTLKYVTQGQYGTNYGSRSYVVAPDGQNYYGWDLRNK